MLLRITRISADEQTTQPVEDLANVVHALWSTQCLAHAGEQRNRQDRPVSRDGQRSDHGTKPLFPLVTGPGQVEQSGVSLVHRARQLGQVDRKTAPDGLPNSLGHQVSEEPLPAGSVEDGRACRVRDAPARQVTGKVFNRGPPQLERVPRRASRRVGPRGDDQAQVARGTRKGLAHGLSRDLRDLIETVEDDPDLRCRPPGTL